MHVGVTTRARMGDFERSKRHCGDLVKSHIPSHTMNEIERESVGPSAPTCFRLCAANSIGWDVLMVIEISEPYP